MNSTDAELLEYILILAGDGNYIEIGTLYGGSAILAALVKKRQNQAGTVYAIDPMDGYYGGPDTGGTAGSARGVSKDDFRENLKRFGVNVELVEAKSSPWPLENVIANVILIDGCHMPECIEADWMNASRRSDRFVIFHDYNDPEIKKFVDEIQDWKMHSFIETMAVMERDQ